MEFKSNHGRARRHLLSRFSGANSLHARICTATRAWRAVESDTAEGRDRAEAFISRVLRQVKEGRPGGEEACSPSAGCQLEASASLRLQILWSGKLNSKVSAQ